MFKSGNTNKGKIYSRLLFVGGLVVLFLLLFSLTQEIINRRQIDRQIKDYQAKIDKLKTENGLLADKISTWNISSELEASARVKLGLEKPGEQTIIIERPGENSGQVVAIKSNQEVIQFNPDKSADYHQPNPIKWWNYFFK